jgi:tetratricopeptide (TPR) repeat protein
MNSEQHEEYRYNEQSAVIVYEEQLKSGEWLYFGEQEFLEIIEHYENEDQIEEAITAVKRAINYHPFSVDFYIIKASLYIEILKPEFALESLAKGKLLGSIQYDIFLLEAECYMLLNNLDQAVYSLDQAKAMAKKDELVEVFFCEALVYEHFHMLEGCFDSLRKSLLCNPRHGNSLIKMWWCTEMTERYTDSCYLYHELLEKDPYNSRVWYNLGHAYACLKNYEKSIESFEFACLADPKFELAYRDGAEICMKFGQYDSALYTYQDLMEFSAPDADILSKTAYCYSKTKEYVLAKDYYTKAIALEPDNSRAYFGMALNGYEEECFHEALAAINHAIDLDESFEEYILLKADICAELGDSSTAENCYNKAIDLAPENQDCWLKYFTYLIQEGIYLRAFYLIEESEFYHQGTEISTAKIIGLCASGRTQEAKSTYLQVCSEDCFDIAFYYDLLPDNVLDVHQSLQ